MRICNEERDEENVLDFCGTEVLWVNFDYDPSGLSIIALFLHTRVAPPV
jgi:hypothetical protein